MPTTDGRELATPGGRTDAVLERMREVLLRQRTHSIICNGPADWPLLTLFDDYLRSY